MSQVKDYIAKNKERFLKELFDIVSIPSISADPAHAADMQQTADAVKKSLELAGAENVEICETPGFPIVYGDKFIDAKLPTVLVYGHYDVQPVDPIELWDTDPFEPIIKKTEIHPDGAIFGRGSSDDKGQVFMHIKALEIMNSMNDFPCNMKFMIEGEEEIGSSSLGWFVERNQDKLSNDVILISDTGMISNSQPSITTGLRGLSHIEIEVTGPNRDLHSGLYGGAVPNPINVLTKMIASLHDDKHKITIPGFYDDVIELSAEERADMAKAPFSLDSYKKALDLSDIQGEEGYSTVERATIRPALDVNGIWGGYTGEGTKTVIASSAFAKISMRLVPGQDPAKATKQLAEHLRSLAPASVKVKVQENRGGHAYVTPIDNNGYIAAAKALKDTFGIESIPTRSGGSIPIVALFEKELGSKSILIGFGLDSDSIHSPNEHFGVFNYLKGIETIPLFYKYFAELEK